MLFVRTQSCLIFIDAPSGFFRSCGVRIDELICSFNLFLVCYSSDCKTQFCFTSLMLRSCSSLHSS